MSTPIKVMTGRQMQDSRLLLEQLLQVARMSALEEMASGIAHELNQPIGAITTFAQAGQRMLERSEPMVGEAAEVMRHISHEALNAGEGIRRIRSLFHGHHAERTDCNLADVVAELIPVLELLAVRSGATLQFSSQRALPSVAIDRLRIQHVLFALVQNALEAPTRSGETNRLGSTAIAREKLESSPNNGETSGANVGLVTVVCLVFFVLLSSPDEIELAADSEM